MKHYGFKERVMLLWGIPAFPVLFLINFIFGLTSSFFAPFSSLFGIEEVGMSNIGFGIFMTLNAIGGVMISSYIAKLSDTRMSRKKIMIVTSVAGMAGYILFAFLRNYAGLVLTGFFVLGMSASTVPQLWAYARDVLKISDVKQEDIPFIMNVFRMFFALSWTVGPALGSWLLLKFSFKGLFLFVAAGYFVAFLIIILLLKDISVQKVTAQKVPRVGKYIKQPRIFAYLAAAFFLSAAVSIHMLNVPQFVTKILHGTEMDVGFIFSVPPIFEVPLMVIIGVLATKMDNARLIKIGFFTAFIYFLLFNFVRAPWQIYPIQFLSALQTSITAGIAIAYFQDFIPEAQGIATTLYMNTTTVGSTAGYFLFGLITEWMNYEHMIIVYTIFAGVGLMLLVTFGKQRTAKTTIAAAERTLH